MTELSVTTQHQTNTSFHTRRQKLDELGWWVSIPIATVPVHWLSQGEQRLDASTYAERATTALAILKESSFEIKILDKITKEIFVLDRFRRIYAADQNAGWPYLSASDALEFRPESEKYLAKDFAPKLARRHFAKAGWMLLSSSGSVGRPVLATTRLERFFLTHDLIRIVPSSDYPIGYLYAYISSWLGQAIVTKDQYGSAIKHLEPHHLENLPVPLLPTDVQNAIHKQIIRAYELRDEANDLLDEADKLLHIELGIPRFDISLVPYLSANKQMQTNLPEIPHPKAFGIHTSELDTRLDASFHSPIASTALKILNQGKYPLMRLDEMPVQIHLPARFKRIYVKKEFGVPFLRPSHLPQMRPYDLGYISRNTRTLESLRLIGGDVLVSTDGTVGRVSMVSTRMAGWAGSNNLARISYGKQTNANGYLAAFLSTKYGYYQIMKEIYGSVVDHLEAEQLGKVQVPQAPPEIQSQIGKLVIDAYEKKDEAILLEQAAIAHLENMLNPQ